MAIEIPTIIGELAVVLRDDEGHMIAGRLATPEDLRAAGYVAQEILGDVQESREELVAKLDDARAELASVTSERDSARAEADRSRREGIAAWQVISDTTARLVAVARALGSDADDPEGLEELAAKIKRERDEARATVEHAENRLRAVSQILIEEIGADGPANAEDVARAAVKKMREARAELEALQIAHDEWKRRATGATPFDRLSDGDIIHNLNADKKRLEAELVDLRQENDRLRVLAGDIAIRPEEHKPPPDGVREQVAWFARRMEEKLRENDHKGGWKADSAGALLDRLGEELAELRTVCSALSPDPERVIREAADVANFAMMVADNASPTRFAASATPDGVPGEVWIGRRMDHDGHWTFSREWYTTPHGDVLREHYIHASLAQAREEEREAYVAITLAHRGWSEEASHLKNSIIDAIRERGKS